LTSTSGRASYPANQVRSKAARRSPPSAASPTVPRPHGLTVLPLACREPRRAGVERLANTCRFLPILAGSCRFLPILAGSCQYLPFLANSAKGCFSQVLVRADVTVSQRPITRIRESSLGFRFLLHLTNITSGWHGRSRPCVLRGIARFRPFGAGPIGSSPSGASRPRLNASVPTALSVFTYQIALLVPSPGAPGSRGVLSVPRHAGQVCGESSAHRPHLSCDDHVCARKRVLF